MLLKQISYLWASNVLLSKSDFLFLLCLRDPAVQQMKSLECLVHHFYRYRKEAKHLASTFAANLLQDGGKSVTVLLDGYDEFPADLRQNSFVFEILQHKVLPASAVVVSSRPHASTHLRDNVIYRVEILGFSEEDQAHFIQQSLEGQEEKISHLNKYLITHPTIASLCFVPFSLTILLFLYKQQATLPTRSSDLYKLFVCLTICRHLAKLRLTLQEDIRDLDSLPQPYDGIIKQFSKFSFKALDKNQLVFSLAEIKEHCPAIADYPNGFGLLQAVEYFGLMSKTHSFNFIHFSVQEFLAAHYVASLSPGVELSILEEYFWSDTHYNMFNFYVSLTEGQHLAFKYFLRSGKDTIIIDDKFLEDKLQCLRLYKCFYEAGDIVMCCSIEKTFTLPVISFSYTMYTLSPNNLEDITTLLTGSSCSNWKLLDFNGSHIQDYGLQLLHRYLQHSDITIGWLWLQNNDLSSSSDSSLSDIIIPYKVKWLDISYNQTVGETQFFAKVLSDSLTVLETLYMYNMNYSSTMWVINLFSSLKENKTVKWLWIGMNNISDGVCDVLCGALAVNSTMKKLDISGNPISGHASQLILDALKDNNTLEYLEISKYPEDITKKITALQQVVIEKRKRQGCDINLEIEFSTW